MLIVFVICFNLLLNLLFNLALCFIIIIIIKQNEIFSVILEFTELVIDEVFLLLLGHKSKQIIIRTAKAIAEIAKTEGGREKCTSISLIQALVNLLKEEEDIEILTQTSRALGNICYENGYYNNCISLFIYVNLSYHHNYIISLNFQGLLKVFKVLR